MYITVRPLRMAPSPLVVLLQLLSQGFRKIKTRGYHNSNCVTCEVAYIRSKAESRKDATHCGLETDRRKTERMEEGMKARAPPFHASPCFPFCDRVGGKAYPICFPLCQCGGYSLSSCRDAASHLPISVPRDLAEDKNCQYGSICTDRSKVTYHDQEAIIIGQYVTMFAIRSLLHTLNTNRFAFRKFPYMLRSPISIFTLPKLPNTLFMHAMTPSIYARYLQVYIRVTPKTSV